MFLKEFNYSRDLSTKKKTEWAVGLRSLFVEIRITWNYWIRQYFSFILCVCNLYFYINSALHVRYVMESPHGHESVSRHVWHLFSICGGEWTFFFLLLFFSYFNKYRICNNCNSPVLTIYEPIATGSFNTRPKTFNLTSVTIYAQNEANAYWFQFFFVNRTGTILCMKYEDFFLLQNGLKLNCANMLPK